MDNSARRLTYWGVRIMAAWSLILAILSVLQLLVLTDVFRLAAEAAISQVQVWSVFALNVTLIIGFSVSAYGLWQFKEWGRLAFLAFIILWAGSNLVSVILPALGLIESSLAQYQTLNGARYLVSLFIPLVYLNLPQVKVLFEPDSSTTTLQRKENNHDDIN